MSAMRKSRVCVISLWSFNKFWCCTIERLSACETIANERRVNRQRCQRCCESVKMYAMRVTGSVWRNNIVYKRPLYSTMWSSMPLVSWLLASGGLLTSMMTIQKVVPDWINCTKAASVSAVPRPSSAWSSCADEFNHYDMITKSVQACSLGYC